MCLIYKSRLADLTPMFINCTREVEKAAGERIVAAGRNRVSRNSCLQILIFNKHTGRIFPGFDKRH